MATPGDHQTTSLSEAKAALGRKEFARAIEKATEVIAAAPKEAQAYLIRAEALRRLGKPERALADLAVAIRLQPNRPSAYVVRAEIHKKRCQFDQAIADATQAIFLDPDNAAAYSIRATCREAIGDIDGAAADHEELVRIDPTRPSSPGMNRATAPNHAPADRPHPAIPEDDRHAFADGRKPDRSYRSSPAIADDEAAEVLGVASRYKPGVLPRSSPRGGTRSKAPSRNVGIGLGLLAVGVIIGCLVAMKSSQPVAGRSQTTVAEQTPASPRSSTAVQGDEPSKVPPRPQVQPQPPAPDDARPNAPSSPTGKQARITRVRRLRFSLAGDGECRFLLDSRDEPPAPEEAGGEPASLTGVNNGVTRKLESGSYRLAYSFSEGGSIADFTKLNGTSPMPLQGVSADRTSGTLVMTPVKGEKSPGKKANFGFPRAVRTPLSVDLDFDRLDGGTFVLQLNSQVPAGVVVLNLAPDRRRGDLLAEFTLFPFKGGKRGEAVNLLTRRFEADAVAESGFHLPGGYDAAGDRFTLEFGLHGEEPVTIRHLEVEAKIPATFGLSLEPEKGAVKVKSPLKGGAAEKAGFKAGDILISIDGEKLSDLNGTTSRMADLPIGKDIPFVVRRAGQEKTIVVKGE